MKIKVSSNEAVEFLMNFAEEINGLKQENKKLNDKISELIMQRHESITDLQAEIEGMKKKIERANEIERLLERIDDVANTPGLDDDQKVREISEIAKEYSLPF